MQMDTEPEKRAKRKEPDMESRPISTRLPDITVEYDLPGRNPDGSPRRGIKEFRSTELGAARRLYTEKLAAGKNPKLRKPKAGM